MDIAGFLLGGHALAKGLAVAGAGGEAGGVGGVAGGEGGLAGDVLGGEIARHLYNRPLRQKRLLLLLLMRATMPGLLRLNPPHLRRIIQQIRLKHQRVLPLQPLHGGVFCRAGCLRFVLCHGEVGYGVEFDRGGRHDGLILRHS